MNKIEAILFDLGGVLIELDGPPIKNEWLNEAISEDESWRRWGASAHVTEYETGRMSADQFLKKIIEEQGLTISIDEFRKVFSAWPKNTYEGVESLLLELKQTFTLAFYSNTCDLHLPRLMDELNLAAYFDQTFASYEIGFQKPALDGFEYVVNQMAFTADSILFVDDNLINVQAALKAGLRARQVRGFNELMMVLGEEGLIN
ncbi:putative hydrolase of the HAD superfamily [Alteromonadaceae bacterium Bs31]|nr:putative hydrolase of the HAD superfamily [Alteromonadaceae bacterium Bs31]